MGTAGGTFLSVLPNLHSEDVLKTILLAALGAIVSFVIDATQIPHQEAQKIV
jgi:hypothetical protein